MTTCLSNALASAISRLESVLAVQAPFFAREMNKWMRRISPTGKPAGHFEHPRMFPVLQLPGWVAESLGVNCESEFHEAVTYSSVCGYYYTRLIDCRMDGEETISILPIAGVLASEFQFEYQRYFPPKHEFWNHFRAIWLAAAESAGHDAALRDVTREEFEQISSNKFTAAKIPVVAACFFYDRQNAIDRWGKFVDALGRWSQMFDDVLDWHEDRDHNRATYFLSETRRRKRLDESLDRWAIREGHAWAFTQLNEWMADLLEQADALGSAREFLERRQELAREKEKDLAAGYTAIERLAGILQLE
jgi:hypothetical protein